MKLFLVAALCALLTVQVTSRTHLPPDDLGVDAADLSDDAATTSLFARWQKKHGKESLAQDSKKYNKALENFRSAADRVQRNRAAVAAGTTDTVIALNKFSHMSPAEFKSSRLGKKPNSSRKASTNTVLVPKVKRATATTGAIDWKALGYVTSVKDQGECGCCWTFSTTGAIEGAYYKAKKQLISFSEQELVECVTAWRGCDGGVEGDAFNYIKQFMGQNTLASYPFIAANLSYSPTCQSKPAPSRVPMTVTWSDLAPGDASVLNALQTVGPLAVSIALADPFMDYASGIMDPSVYCTPGDNNHAVLLTGAGTDAATGTPYWILKNSWSADWGEAGYFRMSRATLNACGITKEPYMVSVS